MRLISVLLLGLPWVAACSGLPPLAPSDPPPGGGKRFSASGGTLELQHLVKSDIDRMADVCQKEVFSELRLLAEKLYRRNPGEWKKSGAPDIETALDRLMDPNVGWRFAGLEGRYGVDAMQLAFQEDFQGDRVQALVGGLGGMLHLSFNEKTAFFMLDDLDPQKIYNSARNIEILIWLLSNSRNAEGRLFLLSNEPALGSVPANLSFEREFGKMIGQLDMLALVTAGKMNRTLVKVVQSVATAIFLPVGFVK